MEEFGPILKHWRTLRRYSQLDLSLEAELSARHLSFLESGRARPSRSMVLRLSDALQWPRAVTNQALGAAGFAAVYPDMAKDAPELIPVQRAIEHMLAAHDPFPGVAVDRHWNITAANTGADLFMGFAPPDKPANLMEILLASADLGLIENWEEVAVLSLTRLRTEILELGGDPELSAMAQRLSRHPRLQSASIAAINLNQAVIPTIFRLGEIRLSLFSTIAQFGSVQDVHAGEMRIELLFPSDAQSEAYFRAQ